MKHSYSFILLYAALFVTTELTFSGCSISNKLGRYPEPEKFYEIVNDKMNDRAAKVVNKNDSIIIAEDGLMVGKDTVNIIHKNVFRSEMVIPIKLITGIQYSEYYAGNISGIIRTNDGTRHEAERITIIPDSMKFADVLRYDTQTPVKVSEIKKITYTNHWLAVPAGFLAGFGSGLLLGIIEPLPIYENHTNMSLGKSEKIKSQGANLILCTLSGCIIGSVLGYLAGFDYDYYFE
jgi:hypothetical protein